MLKKHEKNNRKNYSPDVVKYLTINCKYIREERSNRQTLRRELAICNCKLELYYIILNGKLNPVDEKISNIIHITGI